MHGNLLLAAGTDSATLLHDGEVPCAGYRGILFAFFFHLFYRLVFPFSGIWGFFFSNSFFNFLSQESSKVSSMPNPLQALRRREASCRCQQPTRALEQANDQDNEEQRDDKQKDFIKMPPDGEGARHGGAFPAGMYYMAKEGRRLAPLPRRLPR
jgi:hypothetical protein